MRSRSSFSHLLKYQDLSKACCTGDEEEEGIDKGDEEEDAKEGGEDAPPFMDMMTQVGKQLRDILENPELKGNLPFDMKNISAMFSRVVDGKGRTIFSNFPGERNGPASGGDGDEDGGSDDSDEHDDDGRSNDRINEVIIGDEQVEILLETDAFKKEDARMLGRDGIFEITVDRDGNTQEYHKFEIPVPIDLKSAKAKYKRGIFSVKFNRTQSAVEQ